MLSRGEESCGEVGLNSGFSGFFMVGDDMSAQWGQKHTDDIEVGKFVMTHEDFSCVKNLTKHLTAFGNFGVWLTRT